MKNLIDPYNEALFEFEAAMESLEAAYARMRAEFDMSSYHYLRLKRSGVPDERLYPLRQKLARIHEGLRSHGVGLEQVYDEHRYLTQMVEQRISEREESGGSH